MTTEWNTRLLVHYTDSNDRDFDVTPITSFTPTFATTAEAQHSIERTHVGVIYSPYSITFSLTAPANSAAVATLTQMALTGQRFKILLQEGTGDDWAFQRIVLDNCVITSASPTPAAISGVPSAQFSGFSLQAAATDNASVTAAAPPNVVGSSPTTGH
ncbi:hypothetical protein [Mycobacterium sp.]|uniref:hypothetical protein n=1 Tax=Mycobacterium sp. TaxID=1785 RepID=UPI003D0AF404